MWRALIQTQHHVIQSMPTGCLSANNLAKNSKRNLKSSRATDGNHIMKAVTNDIHKPNVIHPVNVPKLQLTTASHLQTFTTRKPGFVSGSRWALGIKYSQVALIGSDFSFQKQILFSVRSSLWSVPNSSLWLVTSVLLFLSSYGLLLKVALSWATQRIISSIWWKCYKALS